MALRRLLFYADGSNSSDVKFNFDGNNTLSCIANCIGFCIYDVCLPPPPLPPAATLNNSSSDDLTTSIDLHHRELFPTLIISIVSAVVGLFALLTLYAYFRFRRRARRRFHPPQAAVSVGDANDEEETGGNVSPGGEIEHHIWFIRTQGLDESTIASITSWVYKSSDGLIDGRDCSVCLGEFYDGELVRLLPKCSHAFHLPCIDTWLRSHVNCPLCRAPIVYTETAAVPTPSAASPQTTVISVTADLETASHNPLVNPQRGALPLENGSDGIEIGIVIDQSEGSSSRPSISDLPINSIEEEEDLQPIRRSISLDSFSLDALAREERADEELQEAEGRSPANRKKSRGFLKGNLLRKLPKNMERSLSSQSVRWFFPRNGCPRNSVLPL